MSVAIQERPLTGADVAALPQNLPSGAVRYELWEGVLNIMPPTADGHGSVEIRIGTILTVYGEWQGHGEARGGEVGVYLRRNPDTLVGVDAAFLTRDQLPPRLSSEGYLETVPALVVEVVSPNDAAPEVRRKVRAYLDAGARVVWVADPKTRTLTIHEPGQTPQVLGAGDTYSGDFPIAGLTFPISRIF